MKKEYVLGFLYWSGVLLIQKTHPDWQAGKFNGIGGHIEAGETPLHAMRREFLEEAGADIPEHEWEHFCTLIYPEATIYVFRTFGPYQVETKTDEPISWHLMTGFIGNVVANCNWLIPLGLYDDRDFLEIRLRSRIPRGQIAGRAE
ncbi:MAG: NUDIX domain-containing protein [Syntrophales bacterium]|nr:NUDIX domain-containing protein [Syntrophales bacterium]